jgi:hypothetical protein
VKESIANILKISVQVFGLLGMVFVPFGFHLFTYQGAITNFIFGDVVEVLSSFLFKSHKYSIITSDSASLYALMVVLLLLSLAIAVSSVYFKGIRRCTEALFTKLLSLYLGVVLFKYGLDKFFFQQFYTPQANILYTPLGYLDRDIAYWSIMGVSPIYNLFLGLLEMATGVLLFYKRARLLGLFLAFALMLNIFAVNVGFDISVKIFSFFLLLLAFSGLFNYKNEIKRIAKILFEKQKHLALSNRKSMSNVLVVLCTVFFVMEIAKSVELNLAGISNRKSTAYRVISGCGLQNIDFKFKRVFFHEAGYVILQNKADECLSFKITGTKLSSNTQAIDVHGEVVSFVFKGGQLPQLELEFRGESHCLTLEVLNWDELPLTRNQFHWTIDEIE